MDGPGRALEAVQAVYDSRHQLHYAQVDCREHRRLGRQSDRRGYGDQLPHLHDGLPDQVPAEIRHLGAGAADGEGLVQAADPLGQRQCLCHCQKSAAAVRPLRLQNPLRYSVLCVDLFSAADLIDHL
ncbi:hypothetical protein D3C85_1269700 [compost metagenome]